MFLKEYPTEKIRNVALSAHSSAGKTSLSESVLYFLGFIDRLGRVEDGNTTSDYDSEEIKRQTTINATLLPFEYKETKINLLDLPGYRDFVGEIKNAIRVSDSVIILLDAVSGVEVGTEFAVEYAYEYNVPRVFFINKLDKERSNFQESLKGLKDFFGHNTVPFTLPIGKEGGFSGIVDLLRMKAVKFDSKGKPTYEEIPADMKDEAEESRMQIVEAAAEGDDELTMKFLENEKLTDEEIMRGIREAINAGRLSPVFCGSATKLIGISTLLDFIVTSLPAPSDRAGMVGGKPIGGEEIIRKFSANEPFSAFVFKTIADPFAGKLTFFKVVSGELKSDSPIYNINKNKDEKVSHVLIMRGKKQENVNKITAGDIGVIAKLDITATNDTVCTSSAPIIYPATVTPKPTIYMAISAAAKKDEEKISIGMHRLIEQDPTLRIKRDPEIKQTLIFGMGDTHLDVAVSRLKNDFKIDVLIEKPKVPYRETIAKKAEGQHKYKKQSGGRGQYGDVWLRVEAKERGSGFEFVDAIVGGVIPGKYIPAVEKGIVEALDRGIVSGHPVVDVKATVYDGSYHTVDSSDMAFKIAASIAFKKLAAQAGPTILEPIMNVKVWVPEEAMGDVMGNLNSKRGRILGMTSAGKKQLVEAQVPLAEMFEYSKELRSMTRGSGTFEMEFSHYERVPQEIQDKITAEYEQKKEAEEE